VPPVAELQSDVVTPVAPPGGGARPSRLSKYSARISRLLSRETSSGRFIPEMDGLRFAAISMVVLYHLNGYLMTKAAFYEHGSAAPDWLCRGALVGFHGVELFFVISGFILALPFAAHHLSGAPAVSLHKYYLRRLTRLEPPYFITIFLLLPLGLWVHPVPASAIIPHLAASLAYLHNVIYGTQSTVLGVAWSLEIEVQFYLLVPLLTLVFAIRSARLRRSVLVGITLATLGAQMLFVPHHPRVQLSILAFLQFFLIGFLLADVYLATWKETSRRRLHWDVIALAGWPLLFLALQFQPLTHWAFPALVFVLYCAAFRGRWINRFFCNRWITAVGGMCYSIYLIHYAVISSVGRFTKAVGARLPNSAYLVLQFVLVGSAIVIFCGMYFLVLEKPCMRRDWPQRLWEYAKSVGHGSAPIFTDQTEASPSTDSSESAA
jgi:peptidoglycan/LPS O-acetylase OafA/YrhL